MPEFCVEHESLGEPLGPLQSDPIVAEVQELQCTVGLQGRTYFPTPTVRETVPCQIQGLKRGIRLKCIIMFTFYTRPNFDKLKQSIDVCVLNPSHRLK